MGRRMTLKGQISLCLAAFFLALAGQIFLESFTESGTVLRELDDQMGNFNAISRFQNGVERSLSAMEDYRWEYGDAKALTEELHSAFSVTNAWLWRIESDLGTVSEEQYLLYNAVSTTYDSYTALVDQLEEAVAAGQDIYWRLLVGQQPIPVQRAGDSSTRTSSITIPSGPWMLWRPGAPPSTAAVSGATHRCGTPAARPSLMSWTS